MSSELEATIRRALDEIQRKGILSTHPDLNPRQLDAAVWIVMQHLGKDHPLLLAPQPQQQPEASESESAK